MKVSPSIFCLGIIPLAVLSIIASAIFTTHHGGTSDDTVPQFWLYMFMAGSPSAIGLTGILIHTRRHEHSSFQKVDWLAIALASLVAVVFASLILSMCLRTQKLEHERPNTSLEPTGVGAGSSAARFTSRVAGGSVLGR